MTAPTNIDEQTRRRMIKGLIISVVIIILYILFSFNSFYEVMRKTSSITMIKGDVKVFVNGVWIPLRPGISEEKIKGLKIESEGGEAFLGEKNKIKMDIKPEIAKIKEEEQKVETKKEEKGLSEEELKEQQKLKINYVKIDQNGKWVKIQIEGENIKRILVNDIPFYSASGKYNISIPFKDGEHDLKVLAEGKLGEIETVAQTKILVDLTPPKIEEMNLRWEL
jgi:uncharacterized protein YnzC (UPF0291/DUF896 family)